MKENDLKKNTLNVEERILLGYDLIGDCRADLNDQFISDFNKEIVFDSLLMETIKNIPFVKGVENDEKWFEVIEDSTMEMCDHSSRNDHCPWNEMIENAVEKGLLNKKKKLKFPLFKKYLIAAAILISIVSIVVVMKEINTQHGNSSVKKEQLSAEFKTDSKENRKLVVNNNQILKKCRIVVLDSGTTATIDSGARIDDVRIGDKQVTLMIVKGAVSFSVSKKRSRKFIVQAGVADIVVKGTKFRVIRMDDVLSVAVKEGFVKVIYNGGLRVTTLKNGQAALVFRDTVTVVTNDSMPEIPQRSLLKNFISSDENEMDKIGKTSNIVADSLFEKLLRSEVKYVKKVDLIEDYGCILESKRRYRDALFVLNHITESESNLENDLKLLEIKSELYFRTGDSSKAMKCLAKLHSQSTDINRKCKALFKLYMTNLKRRSMPDADNYLHQYIKCNKVKPGIDKVIIDHAHILRNEFMFEAALYWYEYILDVFSDSKYRSDAEYWISDCIVQKRISKKSALKDTKGPSGW